MMTISKLFDFCASHRLYREEWSDEQNRNVFGKCSNPNGHGHNYRLEVSASGPLDPATGFILNASILSDLVERLVLADVDHKNLNVDVEWMRGAVPTSEMFAERIWQRLAPAIQKAAPTSRLERLTLWETRRIFVTRTRDE